MRVGVGFALLTYYWVVLRTWPRSVLRHASRGTCTVGTATSGPNRARFTQILSAVERAAELHPFRPRCLEQALASRALLVRAGDPARVVIGVRRFDDDLAAHAWVEVGGYSDDGSRPGFVELTQLR